MNAAVSTTGTPLAAVFDLILAQMASSKFEAALLHPQATAAVTAVSGWLASGSNHPSARFARLYYRPPQAVLAQLERAMPMMAAARPETLRALAAAQRLLKNSIFVQTEDQERARRDKLFGCDNWEHGTK